MVCFGLVTAWRLADLAHQPLALLGERDDRRRGPAALRVGDDDRLAAFHHRDDGVGRPQVDTDDLCAMITAPFPLKFSDRLALARRGPQGETMGQGASGVPVKTAVLAATWQAASSGALARIGRPSGPAAGCCRTPGAYNWGMFPYRDDNPTLRTPVVTDQPHRAQRGRVGAGPGDGGRPTSGAARSASSG